MSGDGDGRRGGRYPMSLPDDWPATRDEVRAAGLSRKRDVPAGTPRFEGRAAEDPGPSLRDVVGGYIAEWRARRAGAAVANPDDGGEEEEP